MPDEISAGKALHAEKDSGERISSSKEWCPPSLDLYL